MSQDVLKIEQLDKERLERIMKGGTRNILYCVQCGTCSASCPSGRVTAFKTRQIIRSAILGLGDFLQSEDLWLCTTCYTCLERCPRNVETVPALIMLRNMAVEAGHIIPRHREVAHLFIRYGHAVPINEENIKKRESLGLAKIPPTVHSSKQALEELHMLIKKCGFDKKVEFKW